MVWMRKIRCGRYGWCIFMSEKERKKERERERGRERGIWHWRSRHLASERRMRFLAGAVHVNALWQL